MFVCGRIKQVDIRSNQNSCCGESSGMASSKDCSCFSISICNLWLDLSLSCTSDTPKLFLALDEA